MGELNDSTEPDYVDETDEKETQEPTRSISFGPYGFWQSPVVKIGAVFLAFKIVDTAAVLIKMKLQNDRMKLQNDAEKSEKD
jgi:hypothetical protein